MEYMENCLDWPLRQVLPVIQKRILNESSYFGVPTLKSPTDFWVYQEIITRIQPDVIVEIGNNCGGSALALAHICDLLGIGRVIGLDIDHSRLSPVALEHPRIDFITGDACSVFDDVKMRIQSHEKVMIIEDSSHTYENTLNVLRTFSKIVSVNSYFIVEDGICHHGLEEGPNPGPYEAIESFIAENNDFQIDRSKETFCVTWNPKGYLMKVK